MNAIDSAAVIVMAELLIMAIVLASIAFFISKKKRDKEINEINQFIDQYDARASLNNQPLDILLRETCGLDAATVNSTLENVSNSERELLQKVIQLFLQREMVLLNEISHCINGLSEPYYEILEKVAESAHTGHGGQTDYESLERINQQLIRQLDTAMQTIDEITAEYSRVFSGSQSELELQNSGKKMLRIFNDTIVNLKQASGK